MECEKTTPPGLFELLDTYIPYCGSRAHAHDLRAVVGNNNVAVGLFDSSLASLPTEDKRAAHEHA